MTIGYHFSWSITASLKAFALFIWCDNDLFFWLPILTYPVKLTAKLKVFPDQRLFWVLMDVFVNLFDTLIHYYCLQCTFLETFFKHENSCTVDIFGCGQLVASRCLALRKLCHCNVFLDKKLCSTFSDFVHVYKWILGHYCWGYPWAGLASIPVG